MTALCPLAVTSIQREPVSAVSSDINFPMKGRRGMKDWARSSEDKLFIPREVLSLASAGEQERPGVRTSGSVHIWRRACCVAGAHIWSGQVRAQVWTGTCECTSGACRCGHRCGQARVSAHLGECTCA